jgi:hypothetical protein
MLRNVIDKKNKVGVLILLTKINRIFLQLYLFYGNIIIKLLNSCDTLSIYKKFGEILSNLQKY